MNIELTPRELRIVADWGSMVAGEWGFEDGEEEPLRQRLSELLEGHGHDWSSWIPAHPGTSWSLFRRTCRTCGHTTYYPNGAPPLDP